MAKLSICVLCAVSEQSLDETAKAMMMRRTTQKREIFVQFSCHFSCNFSSAFSATAGVMKNLKHPSAAGTHKPHNLQAKKKSARTDNDDQTNNC